MTPEELETEIDQVAAEPASAASDGQSATSHPIPDLEKLRNRKMGEAALAGTNANGGPRSAWSKLRPARAIFGGGA